MKEYKIVWLSEMRENANLQEYVKEGPQEIEEISVNFLGEDHVWFEFKLKNGQTVQSQCFKGSN